MINENFFDQMQDRLNRMKNPVRLILFTRDMACETCPAALELVRAIKARGPKIGLEIYDLVMDRDKAEQYGVNQVPAIVVQGGNGRLIRFYGLIQDVFLQVLVETILAISDGKVWFPDKIRRAMSHLGKDVPIQVFVETDCVQCRPVAETAIGLGLESDLLAVNIIIASDFPDLIKKYSVKTLPQTIFGMNLQMEGHVTESEFLEMIFEAEGVQAGPDRRCLVCGTASSDTICTSCKTKIQGEALDHKRQGERLRTE